MFCRLVRGRRSKALRQCLHLQLDLDMDLVQQQREQDRAAGMPPWQAIVESTVRRLRLIVLTAAAAVLAMISLLRSIFWGPMAVAIMGGLIVATALTLLGLPAMSAALFLIERPNRSPA